MTLAAASMQCRTYAYGVEVGGSVETFNLRHRRSLHDGRAGLDLPDDAKLFAMRVVLDRRERDEGRTGLRTTGTDARSRHVGDDEATAANADDLPYSRGFLLRQGRLQHQKRLFTASSRDAAIVSGTKGSTLDGVYR